MSSTSKTAGAQARVVSVSARKAAANGQAAANGTAETPVPASKAAAASTQKPRTKKPAAPRTPVSKPAAASAPGGKPQAEPAAPAGAESSYDPATGTSAVADAAETLTDDNEVVGVGLGAAIGGLLAVGQRLLREPQSLLQALPGTASDLARIGRGSSDIKPAKSDKRFTDPAWDSNRFYRTLMQTYLYLGSRADDLVDGLGLEGHAADRAA